MESIHHFALLAPIPLEHLQSSKELALRERFVAFGTRKFELFRKLDEMRKGDRVAALIYPSNESDPGKMTFRVSWYGWYVGCVETKNGRYPLDIKHRPPTTAQYPNDNSGYWAAYWHVEGLRELPKDKQIAIGKIGTIKGGWRKNAPPRGPELVALPEILSYEE
jgi:hypothetical protein